MRLVQGCKIEKKILTKPTNTHKTMSEEYTLLQYENEVLKRDLLYWRDLASKHIENISLLTKLQKEVDDLNLAKQLLISDNEEFQRTNDRIWATTKQWILEDSAIISKQAGQIKYLAEKVKSLEKNTNKDNEKSGDT
jgi:hypothetical protein